MFSVVDKPHTGRGGHVRGGRVRRDRHVQQAHRVQPTGYSV